MLSIEKSFSFANEGWNSRLVIRAGDVRRNVAGILAFLLTSFLYASVDGLTFRRSGAGNPGGPPNAVTRYWLFISSRNSKVQILNSESSLLRADRLRFKTRIIHEHS